MKQGLAILMLCLLATPLLAAEQQSWWQSGAALLQSTLAPSGQQGAGQEAASGAASSLALTDVTSGLRQALSLGAERVLQQVGSVDGFNADPDIHIPLPQKLQTVSQALNSVGMGGLMQDLELKLNRAAEAAAPATKELFLQSVQQMSMEDAWAIYQGEQDAATRYFQQQMTPALQERMLPLVEESLQQVGAVQLYNQVMGKYQHLPLVPNVKMDLTNYALDQGLAGIFHYLAQEEAAIRQDPAKRTTELLQRVFGQ